jgi:saccharopine dehydrogenase-like NADP-dependent oxidoreductase
MKTRLILFGAGKIGDAIVNLLSHSDDYQLTVVDRDAQRLAHAKAMPGVTVVQADIAEAFNTSGGLGTCVTVWPARCAI